MDWVFITVLLILGTTVTAACMVVLFVRGRLNRHHRVDPGVRTAAPLTWLVDPRQPARLHRRLAKVGTTTSAVATDHRPPSRLIRKVEPPPLVTTAEDVRAQAVALDHQLTRIALLAPAARRGALADLGRAVTEIERTTAQLVALSADVRAPRRLPTDDPTLVDLSRRVEWLAQAHAELVALDHQAGLVGPQPQARPEPPTVPLPGRPLPPPPAPTEASTPPGVRAQQ